MSSLLLQAIEKKEEIVAFTKRLVACESPSRNPSAIHRMNELMIDFAGDLAHPTLIGDPAYGDHLRLDFQVPCRPDAPKILVLGHSDTVWPIGTLQNMPFQSDDERLWGPGVLDMKTGLAMFLVAMKMVRQQAKAVPNRVVLLVVSDEEIGSPSSRVHTENEARESKCVLVLEPGTGLSGKLKTSRKGIANYRLTATGQAAHAGVDFEQGASAILELARQIERIANFTDLARGTTVNPGVIAGGTRSNVVAAEASVEIDVRVRTLEEAWRIEKSLQSLKAFDERCRLHLDGAMNRPPMVRTNAIGKLFSRAQVLGKEIGINLEESATGGGSDGNFTAALGIPTLDGLGAVGEGAHASHESVLLEIIPNRTALLAALISDDLTQNL